MKVSLLSWTSSPELLIAASANLCYKDISASAIAENLQPTDVERLLDTVITSGHHSVLEHVTFTFAIDDVSRVLTHQLIRHRVGVAYSQQSQRYTKLGGTGFVTPKSISQIPAMQEAYDNLLKASMEFYSTAIGNGVPKEDARYGLVQSVMTRIVMTVNMRQLIHMFAINACFRSQWEFRELMIAMRREVKKVSLRLASEMQIKCVIAGYCDEKYICKELGDRMPHKIVRSVELDL